MDEQTKLEVAIGRWELWKQTRFLSNDLERSLRATAGKVMIGFFGIKNSDGAYLLTGDQALFRTQLMIALAENEKVLKLLEDANK
jgi:hypothetical protein